MIFYEIVWVCVQDHNDVGRLNVLLTHGWEPYAVTQSGANQITTYYMRRETLKKDASMKSFKEATEKDVY